VFTIGIGLIFATLAAYVVMISQSPTQAAVAVALIFGLIPSAILVLSGVCVLVLRRPLAVRLTAGVVTLAFIADALLSFNPIKLIVSAACLYLVWRTAGQAIAQLKGGGPIAG
jgi:hypothetical protein